MSPVPAEKEKEFTFKIELSDKTVSGTFSEVQFTNGEASVTVKGGSAKTIEGLPEGVTYKVTEAVDNAFTADKETADGRITAEGTTAAFKNTRKTGDLEVKKTVVSSTAGDMTKSFSFTVKLTPALDGKFGDMTFNKGTATFTLTNGQSKSATGLPVGYKYEVSEETADGFVTTKTGETGEISAVKAEAAFTNTKDEGGLIVSKSVKSDVTADKDQEFSFKVELDDKTVNGTYGDMTFENGAATFMLKDGQSKKATGLAKGIKYTVTEEEDGNFKTTSSGATGTIVEKKTQSAEFVNTRKTGSLEISKEVVSPVPAEKNAEYTFTVTLTNGSQKISGTYSGIVFDKNGQAAVTVKGGGSVKIEGVPVGTDYEVEEAEYENFDTTAEGDTGTISETESKAAFKNTRKTGDLAVTKTVVNKNSKNTDRAFTFTVTLGDETISGKFGDLTFNKGEAKFTLKDGGKAEAAGLPAGVSYEVKEETAEGFVTSKTGETGAISEKTAVAAFTNTYTAEGEVELGVKKVLEGRPLENGQFTFILMNADGEEIDRKTCDAAGDAVFDKICYTQDDMDKNEAGYLQDTEISYTVKEVIPEDAKDNGDGTFTLNGYTYDAEVRTITVTLHDNEDGTIAPSTAPELKDLVFTNSYKAEGEIVLSAQKKLLSVNELKEGQFTFELKDANGNVLDSRTNAADGSVTFEAIKYTQDDIYKNADGTESAEKSRTFNYTIREVIPEGAKDNGDGTFDYKGYTYDGTVYTVTVIATDNGDGTITAVDAADQNLESEEKTESRYVFTNAYKAEGTLKLDAVKEFKRGTLKGGEFTFLLKDEYGYVLQSKTNDAAGKVSFDLLTYKLEDVKNSPIKLTISEVTGTREDVIFDETVYTVTVTLADNGDGTLNVTKKIDQGGAAKFVNERKDANTSITLGGVKVLKGQDLKEGMFSFVLRDADGRKIDEVKNDANGNFTFESIAYKLADLDGKKEKVYKYEISEAAGNKSSIIYDKRVYTVVVTVTDNEDGTMTAKADLSRDDIKFINTTRDKTGDDAPLGVLFGGLGLGAAGLAVLLEERRRRGRKA